MRLLIAALVVVLIGFATTFGTRAAEPVFAPDGVAIRGTDPVAYFTEGKPVKGRAEFAHEWNGAKWHFASAANRDAFKADPAKYAPQFGGFCAYGVAQGYAVKTEPEAWKIVDGKLYLNYSTSVQEKWNQDIPGYISTANSKWPEAQKNRK